MTTDPTGDQPRWTVDQDGDGAVYLLWPGLSPSDHADLAALPGDAHAALVQHVRDAAEVPALRARLEAAEAERDQLAEMCRTWTTLSATRPEGDRS